MQLPPHLDTALWPADSLGRSPAPTWRSGHARLDAELPGGGWPSGALIELLGQPLAASAPGQLCGQGELRLLAPALARLARSGGDIVLVAPPLRLHAPALAAWGWPLERLLQIDPASLADAAWATEQALRSRRCAAVVWWTPSHAPAGQALGDTRDRPATAASALLRLALRRLHLAAQDGTGLLFVLRDADCAAQSSPAPLRLICRADPHCALHLQVELLKRRGPPCATALRLDTADAFAPSLGERLGRPALAAPPQPDRVPRRHALVMPASAAAGA
jgi:hypothetical protein